MEPKKTSGTRIPRKLAHDMIEAYLKKTHVEGKERLTSILISKDVLLQMMEPSDCAYVRLYFGIKEIAYLHPDYPKTGNIGMAYVDTDTTLIACATDAEGNFLKSTAGKGDGDGDGEFFDEMTQSPPYNDAFPPI